MTRPYIGPSESQVNAMAPRSTDALARWFAERFADDVPGELHAAGPWFGPPGFPPGRGLAANAPEPDPDRPGHLRPSRTPLSTADLTGGSALGAPRLADAFRRFIEDGADAVEYAVYDNENQTVPHYARPIRANLAWFAVNHPLLARRLFHLGCYGGDWRGATLRFGPRLALEEAEVLYHEALRRLWEGWRDEPPARVLRGVA